MFLKNLFIKQVENSWKDVLIDEFDKDYMKELSEKLERYYDIFNIYPKKDNIFKVLNLPLENIQVVILGQDPYPSTHLAHGLAFSSNKLETTPESLKIIFNELIRDFNVKTATGKLKRSVNLLDWSEQGVFLLNTILTVKKNTPNSHKDLGWEQFTHKILETIAKEDKLIIYALWGRQAQELMESIPVNEKQIILKAPHPASEKYGKVKFTGCGHFSQINSILENTSTNPVKWF